MAKTLDIIIKLVKQGGGDKDIVVGLASIKSAMAQGMAIAGAFATAYAAVDQVVKATVGEFQTYSMKVDDFSNALGTSAEQGSRLIQIGDQLGISTDTMQQSLFKAVKAGMEPSVEGLAKMADRYNLLNTAQEKADFLVKNFGRSGADLAELLGRGSGGVEALNGSIQKGMILTEGAVKASQKLEMAQIRLGEAWQGAKIGLGNFLVVAYEANYELGVRGVQAAQKSSAAWMAHIPVLNLVYYGYSALSEVWKSATQKQADLTAATNTTNTELLKWNGTLRDEAQLLATATDAAQKKDAEDKATIETYRDLSQWAVAYHQDNATMQQAEADLALLRKQGWGEHSQKVMDAKAKVQELQIAEKLETAQFMADSLEKKFMIDGKLDPAEQKFLDDYKVRTGLLSAEDVKRAKSTQDQIDAELDAFSKLNGRGIDWYINVHTTTGTGGTNPVTTPTGPTKHETPKAGTGVWTDTHPPRWIEPVYYYAEGGEVPAGRTFVIDEQPSTRPEAFVSAGGGYVLTKQDAQAALGGGTKFELHLHYSPWISLADKYELQNKLQPFISQGIREYYSRRT